MGQRVPLESVHGTWIGIPLMPMAYVQYGCGRSAPQPWQNFDADPTIRLQKLPVVGRLTVAKAKRYPANVRYGDIVRGLPVASHSCRAVYCSHVLEHLSLHQFRTALINTRRLLADRGIFRFVVYDLRTFAERYVADCSEDAALRFMTDTSLGSLDQNQQRLRGLLSSRGHMPRHLWMWDFPALQRELQTAGFAGIRIARPGDSEEPMFSAVEEQTRWVDVVGIQCYA